MYYQDLQEIKTELTEIRKLLGELVAALRASPLPEILPQQIPFWWRVDPPKITCTTQTDV